MGIFRAAFKTAWREYLRTHHPLFRFKVIQFFDYLSAERSKEAEAKLSQVYQHWNSLSLNEKQEELISLNKTARKAKRHYGLQEFVARCNLDVAKNYILNNNAKCADSYLKLAKKQLKRVISLNEYRHTSHFLLGVVFELSGQSRKALKLYKIAHKLDKHDKMVIDALTRLST